MSYEYKVVRVTEGEHGMWKEEYGSLEKAVNEETSGDWELASTVSYAHGKTGKPRVELILRREE